MLFAKGRLAFMMRRLLDSGYLHVFSANILLQLLGFGSVLLVAKFLSPVELAMIKTAQAYAAVLVILAGAGMTAPVLLYCANPAYDLHARQAMLKVAIRKTGVVSAIVIVLAMAAIRLLVGLQAPEAKVYAFYVLSLPALAMTSLMFAYLQAGQQFARLARSQAVIKSASIAAVMLATYLCGLYGFLTATVLSVYAGLIPLVRDAFLGNSVRGDFVLPGDFFSRATYGMAGTFITMLGQSSDFMLMDFANVDRSDVGRYALASVFLLAAMTLTGSIQAVVTPRFTALHKTPAAFLAYLGEWNRRMPLIGLAVAALGISSAWLLEHWFFGKQYAGFSVYLMILMIKYVIWSNYAVIGAALLGAGVIRSGVGVAVLTMLLSFGLGLPLTRWYGAHGTAWAQVIVSVATLAAIIWLKRIEFRRMFGDSFG